MPTHDDPWQNDTGDASDALYRREIERFERMGPRAMPPLGGRKPIDFADDPLSPQMVGEDGKPIRGQAFADADKAQRTEGEISHAEAEQRNREWRSHISRVATPIDAASPKAGEQIWREFQERYPEMIGEKGEGNEAFGAAISSVAKRMGDGWLNDRFTLYSETAKEMRRLERDAADDPADDPNTHDGKKAILYREFSERFPDLAGDETAIAEAAVRVAEGTSFNWEERGRFLGRVAADMYERGTGKPAARGNRRSQRREEREDDEHRTEILSRVSGMASGGPAPAPQTDMISDMKAIQGQLFGGRGL
jgi:hypothetical protein